MESFTASLSWLLKSIQSVNAFCLRNRMAWLRSLLLSRCMIRANSVDLRVSKTEVTFGEL